MHWTAMNQSLINLSIIFICISSKSPKEGFQRGYQGYNLNITSLGISMLAVLFYGTHSTRHITLNKKKWINIIYSNHCSILKTKTVTFGVPCFSKIDSILTIIWQILVTFDCTLEIILKYFVSDVHSNHWTRVQQLVILWIFY